MKSRRFIFALSFPTLPVGTHGPCVRCVHWQVPRNIHLLEDARTVRPYHPIIYPFCSHWLLPRDIWTRQHQVLTKIFNPLWEFFFQVKKKKLSYLKNKLSYLEKFRLVMCNSYQSVVRKIPVLVQKIPSLGRKSTTLGIWERREGR